METSIFIWEKGTVGDPTRRPQCPLFAICLCGLWFDYLWASLGDGDGGVKPCLCLPHPTLSGYTWLRMDEAALIDAHWWWGTNGHVLNGKWAVTYVVLFRPQALKALYTVSSFTEWWRGFMSTLGSCQRHFDMVAMAGARSPNLWIGLRSLSNWVKKGPLLCIFWGWFSHRLLKCATETPSWNGRTVGGAPFKWGVPWQIGASILPRT